MNHASPERRCSTRTWTARSSSTPSQTSLRVHGYALMPNHYHLMVEVPRENLSKAMPHLGLWTSYNAYSGILGADTGTMLSLI